MAENENEEALRLELARLMSVIYDNLISMDQARRYVSENHPPEIDWDWFMKLMQTISSAFHSLEAILHVIPVLASLTVEKDSPTVLATKVLNKLSEK